MLIEVVLRSKRAQFFRRLLSVLRIWETFAVFFIRRLWSVLPKLTTFAGKFYGVCCRFGRISAGKRHKLHTAVQFMPAYACALKSIIHVPHAPAARKAALTCSAAVSVSASAITHPPPPPPVSFAPNAPLSSAARTNLSS